MKLKQILLIPLLSLGLTSCDIIPSNPPTTKVFEIRTLANVQELEVNSQLQLFAYLNDNQVTNNHLTWETTNSTVASITASGILNGLELGSTKVKVTHKKDTTLMANYDITIVEEIIIPTALSITSETGSFSVAEDRTLKLNVSVTPEEASKNVFWESSNSDVLNVDNTGLVTPVGVGAAVVTVASSHKKSIKAHQVINVVQSLEGETIELIVPQTVYDRTDTDTFDIIVSSKLVKSKVRYLSSNTNIATINSETGYFEALAAGSVEITAYYLDDNQIKDTVTLTINEKTIAPTSITIISTSGSNTVVEGNSIALSLSFVPLYASPEVTWLSETPAIASIDNGLLTGLTPGVAIIRATSIYEPFVTNTISITVTVSLAGETITLVSPGTNFETTDTATFDATVSTKLERSKVRFQSSRPAIATIDPITGAFEALAVGTTNITAYYDDDNSIVSEPVVVSVSQKIYAPTSITLQSSNGTSLVVNNTTLISVASVVPSNAERSVTWSTSDSNLATISSSGTLTAKAAGNVIVYGTSTVNTSIKGQLTITITPPAGYYKVESYEGRSNYAQALRDGAGTNTLKGTGNSKILVVPIQFTDAGDNDKWNTTKLNKLEKGMFGESSETSWESVKSFYYKSSYGKLNISGEVTPALTIDKTQSEIAALSGYYETEHTGYVGQYFYSHISDIGLTNAKLKQYDQDSDGYLDAVYFVYANEYDGSEFWAWVWWMGGDWGDYSFPSSTSKPNVNTYMWASYHFLEDGYGSSGIDAHTMIHETGHILGLDDYYNYDRQYTGGSPVGSLDMMDNNIIDHNAYSKMALEWVTPYYVDGTATTTTITINSFAETGDYILIKNNWTKHTLDEYILIELYTPTNLNKKDSDSAYPKNGLRGFTQTGVRIWHIDARAGVLAYSSYYDAYILSAYQKNPTPSELTTIIAANSPSRSYADEDYKLIHLMQATGVETFITGTSAQQIASNADLFKAGNSFTASSEFFPNGTRFNDNTLVGYTITVESINSTTKQATIKIVKTS